MKHTFSENTCNAIVNAAWLAVALLGSFTVYKLISML
jgi:hypothetical protein